MASGANRNFSDYYMGTGAELAIEVPGFDPRSVKITNTVDGSSVVWFRSLGAANAAAAGGFATSAVGAVTLLTDVQGVSELDGAQGFNVGTSATVNAAGVRYHFTAND